MLIKTPRIAPGNRKCQNLYFYSGVNDVVIKITMDMPNTSLIIEILLLWYLLCFLLLFLLF